MSTVEILLGAAVLAAAGAVGAWAWCRRRMRAVEERWRREADRVAPERERAVADLQARERSILESLTEGVLLLDGEGRVEYANTAFKTLFGVGDEILRRTVIEALRQHELADAVQQAREKGHTGRVELRVPDAPGHSIGLSAAPLGGGGTGSVGGVLVVCHDLTLLKQLENTRRDFVANVSHELRTPLSLIKGYVETLQNGANSDPELSQKFLGTIARNAERLHYLIEDLLVISELESGQVQLRLGPVPLERVVRRVFDDFQARAQSRGVALLEQTAGLHVRADEARLEQVLCNLVDNALKYGPPESEVRVGARPAADGGVEVFVRNDGSGIPEESLKRLFERFYRVDKGRSRDQGGSGLGLAIVKHIVQSHGGKVWVTSEAGKGTTFFFTLPGGD